MLVKQLPTAVGRTFIAFFIERFQLFFNSMIEICQRSEDLVSEWAINMIVDDAYRSLHRSFITRLVRSGSGEGCGVMLTELVAGISKHWFIATGPSNSSF